MENMDILTKLEEYSKAGYVPMHMPGGKRNTEYASTSVLDITEIDGFDNMHNADGIIKNASDRAAKLYGADKTLMLVNEVQQEYYQLYAVQRKEKERLSLQETVMCQCTMH